MVKFSVFNELSLPFENDLNIDHQITYKAVITATRPMEDECVKEIYSFEILSSTEWNYPLSFSPNNFVTSLCAASAFITVDSSLLFEVYTATKSQDNFLRIYIPTFV